MEDPQCLECVDAPMMPTDVFTPHSAVASSLCLYSKHVHAARARLPMLVPSVRGNDVGGSG